MIQAPKPKQSHTLTPANLDFGFKPASRLLDEQSVKKGGWDKHDKHKDKEDKHRDNEDKNREEKDRDSDSSPDKERKKERGSGGFKLKREADNQPSVKSYFQIPKKKVEGGGTDKEKDRHISKERDRGKEKRDKEREKSQREREKSQREKEKEKSSSSKPSKAKKVKTKWKQLGLNDSDGDNSKSPKGESTSEAFLNDVTLNWRFSDPPPVLKK